MNIDNETENTITITFSKDELKAVDSDMMMAEQEGLTDDYWTMRQINAATKLYTDKYNPNVDDDE